MKANGIRTNGAWKQKHDYPESDQPSDHNDKRRYDNRGALQPWNPSTATTQFSIEGARSEKSSQKGKSLQTNRPATAKYVREFHPLSYLFTVVRGNLEDDSDEDGNPRLPSAVPGVLNRRLGREFNAKIAKMNREIDDIQKRIDGMHDKVNSLNKERCSADSSAQKGQNFGNEIYLLVRNVGMWMRRMETKAQLIERIEWSIYILEALQEIDENCNATMYWTYASWRKLQYPIGPDGTNDDWDSWANDHGNNEAKYDKYKSDAPEIIRLFQYYEAAYRRNIEISKLIKDDLIRSGSDEKLSRFLDDNYTRCKGCKALFCRRYDDLFGTRIHYPSKFKNRENFLARRNTGAEKGSMVVSFFCTDCFDIFNPSIIKKMKRDEELKIEKDLEILIREHQKEQEDTKNGNGSSNVTTNNKSNKKRKKKKRKKNKKNAAIAPSPALVEEQQSDVEQEVDDDIGLVSNNSFDDSQRSADVLNEIQNHDDNDNLLVGNDPSAYDGYPNVNAIDIDDDSSMNDVWVDFLLKTGSIIELNAFMDKTIGVEKD